MADNNFRLRFIASSSSLKLFVAFVLFPFASRLALIVTGVEDQLDSLATGLLADLYWSFLLTVVAIVLLRCRLWALLPLIFLWAGTYAVDIEHITALGQLAHHSNIRYLFDGQFIRNSMDALPPLKLFGSVALVALALWLLLSACAQRRQSSQSSKAAALVALVAVFAGAVALYSITPAPARNTLNWHNRNFFAHHLDALAAQALSAFNPRAQALASARPGDAQHPIFAADLEAPRPAIGAARNVLLIVLEGLPGIYIEPVAKRMGAVMPVLSSGVGLMPQLSALAEQSLLVPNFISHRSLTIRGLYSLLCSDFPKLDNSLPKPLEILNHDSAADRCLPRLLRNNGYSTHYFQAANLQFMSKNTVMPFIGFDDVRGKDSLALPEDYYFKWGADDSDFFNRSADWLEVIDQQDKPWFATLLTVGTHHPYGLRDGSGDDSAKRAAVAAADRALAALIARLRKTGIAEDTLILITADESHGVPGQRFGKNWGMMVALAPDLVAREADDIFSTADVTLSIMDYLALQRPEHDLTGRSLFRDYNSGRTLLFSQWNTVAMSTEKGLIISCPILEQSFLQWLFGDGHCEQLRSRNGEMFDRRYRRTALAQPQVELYKLQAIMDTRLQDEGDKSKQSVTVGNNDRVTLHRDTVYDLAAGQYMNLETGTLLTIDFDVSYTAAAQSILELSLVTSDLKTQITGKSLLPTLKLPAINTGERIRLRLSFPVFSDYSHVQANLRAKSLLADGEATVHSYQITTEKKQRFDSLSLELLQGSVTAANGEVTTLFMPPRHAGPLTFTRASDYTLGNTERVSNIKSFEKYGGTGWWGAEPWGRWSKANAEINMFLDNSNEFEGRDLLLTANARVYIDEGRQQVEVWGNGELLDTWELGRKAELFTAAVPVKLLHRGLLSISFVLRGSLISPKQREQKSNDTRKLGMGLIDFTLSRAQ